MFHIRKATFLFSRENQWFMPFHPQASVRCRCASYMYQCHLRCANANRRGLCSATALVRCRENDSKIIRDVLLKICRFFLFVKADVLFWMRLNSSAPPWSSFTLIWLSIPSHTSPVRWSYHGSRAFGTNFHFLSVFVVSEKKFMVQGEDKLKGSAQANLERNRQKFEQKNRPVPIWRRALANWRRALARKSSYFDKIAQLSVS